MPPTAKPRERLTARASKQLFIGILQSELQTSAEPPAADPAVSRPIAPCRSKVHRERGVDPLLEKKRAANGGGVVQQRRTTVKAQRMAQDNTPSN
jgi:hypothetical protein